MVVVAKELEGAVEVHPDPEVLEAPPERSLEEMELEVAMRAQGSAAAAEVAQVHPDQVAMLQEALREQVPQYLVVTAVPVAPQRDLEMRVLRAAAEAVEAFRLRMPTRIRSVEMAPMAQ